RLMDQRIPNPFQYFFPLGAFFHKSNPNSLSFASLSFTSCHSLSFASLSFIVFGHYVKLMMPAFRAYNPIHKILIYYFTNLLYPNINKYPSINKFPSIPIYFFSNLSIQFIQHFKSSYYICFAD
ncbi:MAG: hypothetical protein WC868_10650, partial [Bacteroidales bacterium]